MVLGVLSARLIRPQNWVSELHSPTMPHHNIHRLTIRMQDSPDFNDMFSTDLDTAEARMRRSLELAGRGSVHQQTRQDTRSGGQPGSRPRSRFVQDGEVPVTVVNRHRPQEGGKFSLSGGADTAFGIEQAARAKAERQLQEAQATLHDLQTKHGHAELAHREAMAQQSARLEGELAMERAARQLAESQLEAALIARQQAEAALHAAGRRRPEPVLHDAAAEPDAPPAKAPRKASAKVPSTRRVREPQPVKWWIKR